MAEVTSGTEYSIVRGGSGATGPQLTSLLRGSSYASCYQFCWDLMTYGMDVAGQNTSVTWAACSTKDNGNAESFTEATSNGHTDLSKVRGKFISRSWYESTSTKGQRIAECQGSLYIYVYIYTFTMFTEIFLKLVNN